MRTRRGPPAGRTGFARCPPRRGPPGGRGTTCPVAWAIMDRPPASRFFLSLASPGSWTVSPDRSVPAVASSSPGPRQIQINSARDAQDRAALLTDEVRQRRPVRGVHHIDGDGDAGGEHLRRVPPAAGNEQQFSRLENERGRDRLRKERKGFQVRILDILDAGEVRLILTGIHVRFLLRLVDDEPLPAINLHEKGMRGQSVV